MFKKLTIRTIIYQTYPVILYSKYISLISDLYVNRIIYIYIYILSIQCITRKHYKTFNPFQRRQKQFLFLFWAFACLFIYQMFVKKQLSSVVYFSFELFVSSCNYVESTSVIYRIENILVRSLPKSN